MPSMSDSNDAASAVDEKRGQGIAVLEGAMAVAVSAVICTAGTAIARGAGLPGLAIP